jgi:hypothetical protein
MNLICNLNNSYIEDPEVLVFKFKCTRPECTFESNEVLKFTCIFCANSKYCSLTCQLLDWTKGEHSHVHTRTFKPYPPWFILEGFNTSYSPNTFISDDLAPLSTVKDWVFEDEEHRIRPQTEYQSREEEANLCKALEQNQPQVALDLLKKVINRFNFADKSLKNDRVRLQAIARAFAMRAWCNWRMVRRNTEMGLTKRVEKLELILRDAAFLWGKFLTTSHET